MSNARMRSVTNYFIINLSMADIINATFNVIPNFTYMLTGNWPFGEFLWHQSFKKKINVYPLDQDSNGTRYPPASQQDSQYPTQSDTVLKIIWYEATWKFYPWYLKYPKENEVPRNSRSNISTLLANRYPPAIRLFCSLPDRNPPDIEKTLPVGPCFFSELSWGGLLGFFCFIFVCGLLGW